MTDALKTTPMNNQIKTTVIEEEHQDTSLKVGKFKLIFPFNHTSLELS